MHVEPGRQACPVPDTCMGQELSGYNLYGSAGQPDIVLGFL